MDLISLNRYIAKWIQIARHILEITADTGSGLVLCKHGIHYCTNLFEIFNYYFGELDKDIAIYEIEVGDKILTEKGSSLCCTNSCILKKRLYKEDIIKILNRKE